MNIKGLNKAEVLAALYNNSKQQGLGFLHIRGQKPITADEAAELLKEYTSFDYLHGRVMKVELSGDNLSTLLYDRDNGEGAAERALAPLARTIQT
jgi:hypothetical protein